MTKDVNLNSDTWTKMAGALGSITEGSSSYGSSYMGVGYSIDFSSGKAGFAKRIDDLVKISEKAKNLIAEKDTDGVVSFSYHDDRESSTTLQVSLGKLERYSSNVSRYVKEKIDQPFYEAMDKVGARLEALSIRSYTTTNTVGFKKTEVVVDTTGSRFETREVSPQTIGLSDLYQVESPYKTALARSYEQFKASETYKEHKLSQDDYLMAMHHTRAFVYKSIDDQKESLEFWRDLTLSTGVVILTIFCPPAGAVAGFVLAGAEMYSATTGKDWGTGRELDTTERGLRAGFALFDLIPCVGYVNDLAKSGSKVAAKEFIQTSIQKGMAQGAKNLDSFKQVLKQVKGFGDTILTNMDTYAKQLDTLVKSKVSTLADNLADKLHHADEAISEAARNFRLNVGLEPQLVGGLMPSSSPGRLSDLADNLQAFAKSLDGSVDEVVEGTSRSVIRNSSDNVLSDISDELANLRTKWNVPETDTIAVGKTDVKGLEEITFEGGSPKVRKEAGFPDLDTIMPNREIQSPKRNPLFTRHAEEDVINQFVEEVNKKGLNSNEVTGTLVIHQSNPTGVCTTCFQGLKNPNVPAGILKQLSEKYPNLIIKVTTEGVDDLVGRMNFIVKNGKLV